INGASCVFFFFQAEDGIRDLTVTGVQTCALPICDLLLVESVRVPTDQGGEQRPGLIQVALVEGPGHPVGGITEGPAGYGQVGGEIGRASCRESVDLGGRRIIKKKKRSVGKE